MRHAIPHFGARALRRCKECEGIAVVEGRLPEVNLSHWFQWTCDVISEVRNINTLEERRSVESRTHEAPKSRSGDPALRRIATSKESQKREARTLEGPKPEIHLDHSSKNNVAPDLTSEA
jgi:hypothetical protein